MLDLESVILLQNLSCRDEKHLPLFQRDPVNFEAGLEDFPLKIGAILKVYVHLEEVTFW